MVFGNQGLSFNDKPLCNALVMRDHTCSHVTSTWPTTRSLFRNLEKARECILSWLGAQLLHVSVTKTPNGAALAMQPCRQAELQPLVANLDNDTNELENGLTLNGNIR